MSQCGVRNPDHTCDSSNEFTRIVFLLGVFTLRLLFGLMVRLKGFVSVTLVE